MTDTPEIDKAAEMRAAEIERWRDGPVIKYLDEGHSTIETAQKFGIPEHTVRKIRLAVSGRKDPRMKPSRIKEREEALKRTREVREAREARDKEILRLRATEMSAKDVATRIGISPGRVKFVCRENGVPYPMVVYGTRPRRHTESPARDAVLIASDDLNERRTRISCLMSADRNNRPAPKITLPRVSILEGVTD